MCVVLCRVVGPYCVCCTRKREICIVQNQEVYVGFLNNNMIIMGAYCHATKASKSSKLKKSL